MKETTPAAMPSALTDGVGGLTVASRTKHRKVKEKT